ncbi:MAG: hypothetical protein ACD_39C00896G0002 [uncultured bacterium]|nr:MAG: hypothetical protein ACD_39C00896G0002 [uncultured bacterium]
MIKIDRFLSILLLITFFSANAYGAGLSLPGGLSRIANLEPGGKTEGKILVRNDSAEPQTVKAYQTDYLFYADGRNLYGKPGTDARSNASWVTFFPQRLEVLPKEVGVINYVVQVPADSKSSGTFWSILMVEPVSKESPEVSDKPGKINVGISTVVRYAVQIITNLGDPGERKLKFLDKQLTKSDKDLILQVDLENTGQGSLTPTVWAELFDEKGSSIGRFEGGRVRIFPTCSARFKVNLSDAPKGKYSALVVADNGDDNVFGARYQLEIP